MNRRSSKKGVISAIVVGVAGLLVAACGKRESPPKSPPAPDLSGAWVGSFICDGSSKGPSSYTKGSFSYNVIFVQEGDKLKGVSNKVGTSGTLSDLKKMRHTLEADTTCHRITRGHIAGNTVEWTCIGKGEKYGVKGVPYTRTESIAATVEGDRISGTYEVVWVIGEETVRYWGRVSLIRGLN